MLPERKSTKKPESDDSEDGYQRESPRKSRSQMTQQEVIVARVNENNLNWVTQ